MTRWPKFPSFILILFSLAVYLIQNASVEVAFAAENRFVVVGYLPDYRLAHWDDQIDPCTDLILFGMSAPANGAFDAKAFTRETLARLGRVKDQHSCRLLFTVGGWKKSAGFSKLSAEPKLREQFASDAVKFCKEHGFDGIDYDWEHPADRSQVDALTELIRETKRQFSKHGLIVTIAQAGWQDLGAETYRLVDRVHLMSYDHPFPQATYPKTVEDVTQLIKTGCPANKIVVGVPFYGRDRNGNAKSYADLIKTSQGTQGDIYDGYALNTAATIDKKIRFAGRKNLAGIMIWEIGQDTNGPNSLRAVIRKSIRSENQH